MSDAAPSVSAGRLRLRWLLPAVLLALQAALLTLGVSHKTATVDEVIHVPSGVSYWHTGDFSVNGLNPPLAKLWMALPVLPMRPDVPAAAPGGLRGLDYEWDYGHVFLACNEASYDAMILRARAAVMVLSVVAGLVLFLWANRLMGFWCATLALALYVVNPDVLAHGSLATQDTAMMLATLGVLFAFDSLGRSGSWWRVVLLGVLLGVACLVKFTGLLLAVILPFAFLAGVAFGGEFRLPLRAPFDGRFAEGRPRLAWRSFVALVAAALVALVVVNAAYGFRGTCRSLDPDSLSSAAMRSVARSPLGALPVPLPAVYVTGLDGQQADVERCDTWNYLNGEWSKTGWWSYYLEAFALKTPLGALALVLLGAASLFVVKPERRALAAALVITAAVFWAANSFSNKQLGLRYMLPVFPLLFMLAGRSALIVGKLRGRWAIALAVLLVLLAGWAAADAVGICPDYLAYFNPVAGGPEGGPRFLLDSNIDWGQDLSGLADWLRRENVPGPVYLAYFGEVPPSHCGIEARRIWRGAKGIVAVSVNYLYGMPYRGNREGEFTWLLRDHKPVAVIGHTIYVYRLERP